MHWCDLDSNTDDLHNSKPQTCTATTLPLIVLFQRVKYGDVTMWMSVPHIWHVTIKTFYNNVDPGGTDVCIPTAIMFRYVAPAVRIPVCFGNNCRENFKGQDKSYGTILNIAISSAYCRHLHPKTICLVCFLMSRSIIPLTSSYSANISLTNCSPDTYMPTYTISYYWMHCNESCTQQTSLLLFYCTELS